MARQRKTYTAEFKIRAVRFVIDQRPSMAEAARQFGIRENLLRLWKKVLAAGGANALPGHGHLSPAGEELHRLRAEVVRLSAERDLLKKAVVYFASPPS